jgi:hypothetical protein
MGYVVIGSLFEPGTEVRLFRPSEEALRVDGYEELAGDRLADDAGSVGFDGLEPGVLYVARGFSFHHEGAPVEVRVRALSELGAHEVAQPPAVPTPQPVGTQEKIPLRVPVGAPAALLGVGVPAGLPAGVPTTQEA